MRIHALCLAIAVTFLATTVVQAQDAKAKGTKTKGKSAVQAKAKAKKPNSALKPIEDKAGLPRVLLIGDSISIGYTLATRKCLEGKANVHRIPTNGGFTTKGLENYDAWIGKKTWDVIHFNWGLHDLKYIDGKQQVPIDQYEKNLTELVKKLKKTGATLIWCATTPYPKGVTPRRDPEDAVKYNAVAKKIMNKNGIAIDDLYAFALPKLKDIQNVKNVHFSAEGSKVLAKEVAKSIETALKVRAKKPARKSKDSGKKR